MTMEQLVAKLNEASEAYYNGKEIMTNKEFDSLLDELKDMEAAEGRVLYDSPTVRVGFAPVDSLPKFIHKFPALSLDKTKSIEEFTSKFYKGIEDSGNTNDSVVLMWKLDGSTVQAYYDKGELQHLVTRGNGEVGNDITHNARAIYGIPLRIPFEGEVVVRGEALISYNDFEAINVKLPDDQKFKNPRNFAAASIQMLDPKEVIERHVLVKAFNLVHISPSEDWVENMSHSFSGRLQILDKLGFYTVERCVNSVNLLKDNIAAMTETVDTYIYPVDGLVAAMDNYEYTRGLKGTEHHPHVMSGYAFKWEDRIQKTTIREIEWSPSRTGLLNPVAIFDPVEIDGTTVQRASLHNVSVMRKMNIRIGYDVGVIKSNMIIPQIVKNFDIDDIHELSYDEEVLDNVVCPSCKAKAVIRKSAEGIEAMYCLNEECIEKLVGKLAHFCERDCMDIQGMSEETIRKLIETGFIKEYADFFRLEHKAGIAFLPGFGKQSYKKMCDAAEKAKKTTFVKFITALGITDIGKGQAKTLYKYISQNYDKLSRQYNKYVEEDYVYRPVLTFRYMALNDFDFSIIDGIGKIISDEINSWAHKHWEADTPETRVTYCVEFIDEQPTEASTNSKISGKSFCITGKLVHHSNRQALVDVIERFGGKCTDAVSSKTDYLINNDVTSTSGKNKKAHDLNIPIISEEDFLNIIKR